MTPVTEKTAIGAAIAAPILAAGVTVADVTAIAQIAAYVGSALGGLGAAIYYIVKAFRKDK